MEIVIEDIEALNFDLIEETDEQQKDWRFQREECKYNDIYLNQYCVIDKLISFTIFKNIL